MSAALIALQLHKHDTVDKHLAGIARVQAAMTKACVADMLSSMQHHFAKLCADDARGAAVQAEMDMHERARTQHKFWEAAETLDCDCMWANEADYVADEGVSLRKQVAKYIHRAAEAGVLCGYDVEAALIAAYNKQEG